MFNHLATLGVWSVLAAMSVAVNLFAYGWAQLNIGPFDGPTTAEQVRMGGDLVVFGLLYATASVALLHGTRAHPRRMLAPWMLLAAVAGIHLLLGVPVLLNGLGHGGAGGLGLLTWLNPFTYVVAIPTVLTLARPSNWEFLLPKVVGLMALTTGGMVVFLATT